MQEPLAAEANDDQRSVGAEVGQDHPSRLSTELDGGELTSLVDGIAMLGRFEAQLAEFEQTLGEAVAGGS